ncbi:hypothetical protein [Alysiella filiformis]|nr:hypothetical protein [Alysiella filiformis]QMT31800.1 hypothetical protein H3L97_02620 [Alysiella filiformis]UBQ55187.1 hypothetical protein JF568_06060 [Alysiella filiformis DSM 16848]
MAIFDDFYAQLIPIFIHEKRELGISNCQFANKPSPQPSPKGRGSKVT